MAAGEIFEILAIPQFFHFLPGIYTKNDLPPRNSRHQNGKMWGIFFLDSAGSQTLDFFPSSKKMEGIYHENRKNGSPFIFCWDWDLIRSVFFFGIGSTICRLGILWPVLVGVAGSGSRRMWLHRVQVFQAPSFFLFRLEGEVEGRVTKRPKKKPCLWGKKKNLPQTPKWFLMDIRCKTNKISRWILGLCASKSDCSHNKRFDKNSWDACCRSWDILQIVIHSFCSKET